MLDGSLSLDRFLLVLAALGLPVALFDRWQACMPKLAAKPPADRLFTLLALPIETGGAEELPRHCQSIAFSNITLSYPDREVPALDGVSFSIPYGQTVAIIGPNGCGKTTLVSLLPGLVRPDRGQVHIDGVDINTVQVASLRHQMAMVTQDAIMLRGTIAENIDFGRGASLDQIHAAIQIAEADFVHSLPDGLNTMVAEGGISFRAGSDRGWRSPGPFFVIPPF